MSKLSRVFSKGKAFIPFITAGDPSLEVTEQLILAMAEVGVDLIELGIPFSDPVAEGPIIQKAHNRALASGVTTDKLFEMLKNLRKCCGIPIALMTYANPVFVYGIERFMKNCQKVQIDAIIVPDVPFEERNEFLPYCSKYDVTLISMISPTSKDRIQMIAQEAQGFIYCVSSMGVTGTRKELGNDVAQMVKGVGDVKDIPCAIGFGISSPEQAAQMAGLADGVIIGSAIVKIVEEFGEDCVPYVMNYVCNMIEVIKM